MNRKFIVVARWVLLAGLPAFFIVFLLSEDQAAGNCAAIFACTTGAMIGLTGLAPCHKKTVALLIFGLGLSFSLEIFTLAPEQAYAAASHIRWSGDWKPSACGMIGSVIGFLVARKFQP